MHIRMCVLYARDCVCYTGLICLLLITKFKIRKFYVDMRAWYIHEMLVCFVCGHSSRNMFVCKYAFAIQSLFHVWYVLEDILYLFHCARWYDNVVCVRAFYFFEWYRRAFVLVQRKYLVKGGFFIEAAWNYFYILFNNRFSLQLIN